MASIAQRVYNLDARIPALHGIGAGASAQSKDPNEIEAQSIVKRKSDNYRTDSSKLSIETGSQRVITSSTST